MSAARNKCAALRRLLADHRWHHMRELRDVASWRYGGRLYELRRGEDGGKPLVVTTKCARPGEFWYRAEVGR